jgi:hypothetical protein
MKTAAVLLIAAFSLGAQTQVSRPLNSIAPVKPMRIGLGTLNDLEKRFDGKLAGIGTVNDPLDLLGTTRGIYLDGFGAIFTSELSLIVSPTISPFHQSITEKEKAQTHQRKAERLPLLKKAMHEIVKTAAQSLVQVPENQQIVLAVRLDYLRWEDTTGLPGLIVMRADRKSAMADNISEEQQ